MYGSIQPWGDILEMVAIFIGALFVAHGVTKLAVHAARKRRHSRK